MFNYLTNCWSYNQNETATMPQIYPKVLLPENCYRQDNNKWSQTQSSNLEIIHEKLNISCGADFSSMQYNPVQYTLLTPEPAPYPVFHLPRPSHDTKPLLHINVVPTKTGSFRTIVKRKRKRTVFTTEQIEVLENIFKRKQYITREERQAIASHLQVNDKPLKVWFQNRRFKSKSEQEPPKEPPLNESGNPNIARLSSRAMSGFVDSQIKDKVDQPGYVTLDDGLMTNLVNVMDDVFTNNISNVSAENLPYPMYEPVSPATSASDSNEEDNLSSWQPPEPNESLRILFDLQYIFERNQ